MAAINSEDGIPSTALVRNPLELNEVDPREFTILIADDLEDTRFVLRRALSALGYNIIEAKDGEQLLSLAEQHRPDLMLVDILMPKVDGLTALSKIRSSETLAYTYVILLTGKSSVHEKIEGFQFGADDYITKPYSLAELKARVNAGIRLKSLHRNLSNSQQQLIRQEKLATIGAMAAGVAHEFNNIMSAISGYAQLALQNPKFSDRLAEVALEQSKRAQRITGSLATFAGNAAASVRPVSISALLDSAECLLEKEIHRREVEVVFDSVGELPSINVNLGQIQEVLVHLILNALQATQAEKGDKGKVHLRCGTEKGQVFVEVDDNGPGILEEHRHKIFDPFFTTKGALGNSAEPGTGLGLTFSLNIAESHSGSLDLVPSQLGGACMRLMLPISEFSSAKSEPISEVNIMTPQTLESCNKTIEADSSNPRLILVEDDLSICDLLCELFVDHQIALFSSGEEALPEIKSHPTAIVVLDVNLDGKLSGLDVLQELKNEQIVPSVILTSGDSSLRGNEVDYPRLAVLAKPYSLVEMEKAVEGFEVENIQ